MTKEQQRIVIAKVCGWENCYDFTFETDRHGRTGRIYGSHPIEKVSRELPDYLNDLNAMHEAERILLADNNARSRWFIWMQAKTDLAGTHATAPQRAEAFLRTIGKWTEG